MLSNESKSITAPSFSGFVDSTYDALILFEASLRGICPQVGRRLQEKERYLITSGSVFVFDEKESGIKRWTDGLLWSPSRILGNFLIYRELDSREPSGRGTGLSAQDVSPRTGSARDRCLSSSTYRFKNNGLVKKTISLADMHIICYYRVNDVVDGRLRHPSSVPELLSLDISSALLLNQNFRIPVKVEVGPDGQARFAGEDEPSSVPSGNAFETTSHARKPSPAERRLSLDTSSRLQEAPQAVGPLVQAPPSMGGPSSSSTVAGPPYRPAAVRTYSGGPIGSQKQRYEPYPSRPSAQNTAPASPIEHPTPLPFADPSWTRGQMQKMWTPTFQTYNPQSHRLASVDQRGQPYPAIPSAETSYMAHPQYSQASLSSREWVNVDSQFGLNLPGPPQNKPPAAPSSSSPSSTELPPGKSSSMGYHYPEMLPDASEGKPPPPPPPVPSFPYDPSDIHNQYSLKTSGPILPRSGSQDLSGHLQRLETQSDPSAPASPFDASRRSSLGAGYGYIAPTSQEILADGNGLALTTSASPISPTFPPGFQQQQFERRSSENLPRSAMVDGSIYGMRPTGMVGSHSASSLSLPRQARSVETSPAQIHPALYESPVEAPNVHFFTNPWGALPQQTPPPPLSTTTNKMYQTLPTSLAPPIAASGSWPGLSMGH